MARSPLVGGGERVNLLPTSYGHQTGRAAMETDNFDDDVESEPAGPYARSADSYFAAGWAPIPVIAKWPPPTGWTGRDGQWPSFPDIQAWKDIRGADNVALRLPDGVIGVDVDSYGDKHGAQTLDECEQRWGALPPTWVSTSRVDGSGIRYFRTPKGLSWPGQLPGGDVELIQWCHRYSVVAPSLHPSTGDTYGWLGPDDVQTDQIPKPGDLPVLPSGWIIGLVRGQFAEVPRAEVSARTWLVKLGGDQLCVKMAAHCDEALSLITSGSRHDALLDAQMHVIRAGERGHTGARSVLIALQARFSELVTGDGSRSVATAEGEWARALDGAVSRIAATPTARQSTGDPCENVSPASLTSSLAQVRADDDTNAHDQQDARQGESESVEQRSSWRHVDLGPLLRGDAILTVPTVLSRSDGQALLYPSRINGLLGPSESGKSWVALEAARQVLCSGGRVLLLDFEDSAAGLIERLRSLGVTDALIATSFRYVNPDVPLDEHTMIDLASELAEHAPVLIILDGVNAAMSLLGYELMSNKDATRFSQTLMAPLALTGAVVVYIDHVPKNGGDTISAGGIGAQAKRAMTTGAAYRVDVIDEFGKGRTGLLSMLIDKDRPGVIRGNSAAAKHAGVITIASSPLDGSVSIKIAPEAADSESGEWEPTVVMRKIEQCLLMQTQPISGREVLREVGGRKQIVDQALHLLARKGITETSVGPNRSTLHQVKQGGSQRFPAVPGTTPSRVVPNPYFVGLGEPPERDHPSRSSRESLDPPSFWYSESDDGE